MKPIDLTSILLFAILAGGILTFLGVIIKYFNAGDVLNFFNEKRQDKDKISKLVGTDLLFIGLSVILIAVISLFINQKYYNIMMISQTVIVLLGLAVTLYHQFFKCFKN